MASEEEKIDIENDLEELEGIVEELEGEELELERSIELFEEGIDLAEEIQDGLSTAEVRLKRVIEESGLDLKVEDFDL